MLLSAVFPSMFGVDINIIPLALLDTFEKHICWSSSVVTGNIPKLSYRGYDTRLAQVDAE